MAFQILFSLVIYVYIECWTTRLEYNKILFEITKFRNLLVSRQYVQIFIFYREKSYNVSMLFFSFL